MFETLKLTLPQTGTSPNWPSPQLALPQSGTFWKFFVAIENLSSPTACTPLTFALKIKKNIQVDVEYFPDESGFRMKQNIMGKIYDQKFNYGETTRKVQPMNAGPAELVFVSKIDSNF